MSLRKIFFGVGVIVVLCLPKIVDCAEYDVTFYNVGQGNCTIIRNPNKQVLVVDAGSSSTIGVLPSNTKKDKYLVLASNIAHNLKTDVDASKYLFFIVTHSDKDHLNLVSLILSNLFPNMAQERSIPKAYAIGVLFGGNKNNYETKQEGHLLVQFLETYEINHWFGKTSFDKEKSPGLCFVPKKKVESDLSWHKLWAIKFLSVASDAKYKQSELSRDEDANAESIVMRVHCGNTSFMLTGDKTQKEIKFLINRFIEEGAVGELETDVLLSTHHGSSEDFSSNWVKAVNPRAVVFSSGRSSFGHPRREAVLGSFDSKRLWNLNNHYHFIQFDGAAIRHEMTNHKHEKLVFGSVFQETANSERKAAGYMRGITNAAVLGTADQGEISIKISPSKRFVVHYGLSGAPSEIIQKFIDQPCPLSGDGVELQSVYLDSHAIDVPRVIRGFVISHAFLKMITISKCQLQDKHAGYIIDMIKSLKDLSILDLTGNNFTASKITEIQAAWGYRGLTL